MIPPHFHLDHAIFVCDQLLNQNWRLAVCLVILSRRIIFTFGSKLESAHKNNFVEHLIAFFVGPKSLLVHVSMLASVVLFGDGGWNEAVGAGALVTATYIGVLCHILI